MAAAPAAVTGTRQVVVLRIQSNTAVSSAGEAQLAAVMRDMDGTNLESSFQQLSVKNDRRMTDWLMCIQFR